MREFNLEPEAEWSRRAQNWLLRAEEFFNRPKGTWRAPKVEFVSDDVMLMELMRGRNLADIFQPSDQSTESVTKKKDIAKMLIEIALYGLVKEGIMHADLHPSNI